MLPVRDLEERLAGWDYAAIDTGHWPMFTKALELAALLDALPVGAR